MMYYFLTEAAWRLPAALSLTSLLGKWIFAVRARKKLYFTRTGSWYRMYARHTVDWEHSERFKTYMKRSNIIMAVFLISALAAALDFFWGRGH